MTLGALVGVVLGLGLGLLSNVTGLVLAAYGLVLGVVTAVVALGIRKRRDRRSPSPGP